MREERETTGSAVRTLDIEPLLGLALHMANRADEIALGGFRSGAKEETKSDGTPVSRVDREVEAVLRDTIEREHPRAGVLGEEYGEEHGVGRWIIDPIDGTRQFLDGDPRFSILIAYELDEVTRLGVVSCPALEMRWWAAEDMGARVSYRGSVSAARVSRTRRMSKSQGMLVGGFYSDGWPRPEDCARVEESLMNRGANLSRRGVSWESVRVAGAEFDFAMATGYVWDVAPLPVIIREAGGWAHVSDRADDGLLRVVVSNSQLADELADLGT